MNNDEVRIQNALKAWGNGKIIINPTTHRIEDSIYKKILVKVYDDIDFIVYKTKLGTGYFYFKKLIIMLWIAPMKN